MGCCWHSHINPPSPSSTLPRFHRRLDCGPWCGVIGVLSPFHHRRLVEGIGPCCRHCEGLKASSGFALFLSVCVTIPFSALHRSDLTFLPVDRRCVCRIFKIGLGPCPTSNVVAIVDPDFSTSSFVLPPNTFAYFQFFFSCISRSSLRYPHFPLFILWSVNTKRESELSGSRSTKREHKLLSSAVALWPFTSGSFLTSSPITVAIQFDLCQYTNLNC